MTEMVKPLVFVVPGFFILIAFSLAAVVIVWRRGRGPMLLTSPHCDRCRHPIPKDADHCPECGCSTAAWPPRFGVKRFSWRWMGGSGLRVLVVLALGTALGALAQWPVGLPWQRRTLAKLDLATLARLVAAEPENPSLVGELALRRSDGVPGEVLASALTEAFAARDSLPESIAPMLVANLSMIRKAGLADDAWTSLLNATIPQVRIEVRRRHRTGDDIGIHVSAPVWAASHVIHHAVANVTCNGRSCRVVQSTRQGTKGGSLLWIGLPEAVRSLAQDGPIALELRVDVLQAIQAGANSSPAPLPGELPDTAAAEWTRRATVTAPIELLPASVSDADLFTPVRAPQEAPWGPGLESIAWLEIRPVDQRTLVILDAPPRLGDDSSDGLGVSGMWWLVQEKPRVLLGRVTETGSPRDASQRQLRYTLLTSAAIDCSRPFSLVFEPKLPRHSEEMTVDRLWSERIEIPVRPEQLRRLDDPFGTRWVHQGRDQKHRSSK